MNEAPTFGQVVKERRNALGLTQTELARRVGCAAITIRKIESDGLRPSVQMAELIALALNIAEDEQLAFVRLARSDVAPSPLPTPAPAPGEIGLTDLSGRAVKGFHLGERIGSGGFGVVYRALQPSVEREVAVKIILPRYANHPNFIRRFEAEARLIARLEHPHIVPLYDYWREPDAAYLIMRLLRGGSLEDQIKNGPLPLERVSQYTRQIGLALDVAHRHGIIHRDIKPANVLLDEEGNAYLADFGIAKNLEGVNGHSLTEEGGVLIGSPAYISPEQIKAEPVKPQSDIYCLGIMLFEMLTGHKPFSGPTPIAFIQQHLNETLPLLQTYNPHLPPELDAVIRQATARNVADRYRDVPSLVAALQQVLSAAASPTLLPVAMVAELPAQEWADLKNPYQGLRAFSEAEADQFRGRATLIQELFAQLSDGSELARFLAIVGPSGSGKSSVAKAGLVPALRRGGLPGSENWFVVDITPGAHPWEEVEAALLRIAVNPPESLLGQLQEGERGLLRAVQRVLPNDGLTELVLIIDQFEELFTLVADEAVREQFLNSLVAAVLDERSRLRVIVTLRADFYDRPLQYVDFGDLLRQRTVSVLPLTADELEQAIIQPAAQVGVSLEPGLATTIIRDVGDQPGTLPLMQYALTELFAHRHKNVMTRAAYETSGGVIGALARRADEIYDGLNPENQAATRQLLLRLITLGEGVEDTRRRVRLSELEGLSVIGNQLSVNGSPITEYGKHRLLTFDRDPITREPTVEVAHEALLREWGRLRDWLVESREDIRQQRLLADATAQWAGAGQDASYLLRGNRLERFADWADQTNLALTEMERRYLEASRLARTARQIAEEKRRQQELETSRKLVESERQRADIQTQAASRLRRRAYYLAGLLLLTLVVALAAALVSRQNAVLAAEKTANLARSEQLRLAAEANNALAGSVTGDLAALLALRSLQAGWSAPADEALLTALGKGFGVVEYPRAYHGEPIRAIIFSADGQMMLSTGPGDNVVRLWDVASGTQLQQYQLIDYVDPWAITMDSDPQQELYVTFVAFAADETSIFVGDLSGDVYHLDRVTGKLIRTYQIPTSLVWDMAIAPHGDYLLAGGNSGELIQLDSKTGEVLWGHRGHWGVVTAVAINSNGQFAVTGGVDATLQLWDVASGEPLQTFSGHTDRIMDVDISADGRWLLSSSGDGSVRLWEAQTGKQIHQFDVAPQLTVTFNRRPRTLFRTPAFRVAFSPDGQTFVLANIATNDLEWRDVTTGQLLDFWADVGSEAVAFSPTAQTIAVAARNRLYTLELLPGLEPVVLRNFEAEVSDIAFSPDAQSLVFGSLDQSVRLWDVQRGRLLEEQFRPDVWLVEFAPDNQTIWMVTAGNVWSWDVASNTLKYERGFNGNGGSIGLSSGAEWVITSSFESWGVLRATSDNHLAQSFPRSAETPQVYFYNTSISSDGRLVLTMFGTEGEAQLWDVDSGEQIGVLRGHTAGLSAVSEFSADDRFVLTASLDGTARLWDVETLQEIQRFTTPEGGITAVAFSPNGRLVATGGDDDKVRLWDVATGQQVRVLAGHEGPVFTLDFSPDGRLVASASEDQTVRIWHIDINYAIQLVCEQLTRDFTPAEREAYNIPDDEPTCPAS